VGDDTSVALLKAPGYNAGFKIVIYDGLPSEAEFVEAMGLPAFSSATSPATSDALNAAETKDLLNTLARGNSAGYGAWEGKGLPREAVSQAADNLLSAMHAVGPDGPLAFTQISVKDLRDCKQGTFRGIHDGNPVGGYYRYKHVAFLPGGNFLLQYVCAPAPGDAVSYWRDAERLDGRTYTRFSVLGAGGTLQALLAFDEYAPISDMGR